mmetsp:Transcript_33394/g.71294  ORF Transcript_33394/g.71294 Transcript_33394/m.71294 type:complete len:298 (+) Transcript_33394:321-1214(+)
MQMDTSVVPGMGPRDHVSLHFGKGAKRVTDGAAAGAWAKAQVLASLREASVESVWAEEGDLIPRRGRVFEDMEDMLSAIGCVRWFPSDPKRWPGVMGRMMRGVRCACGSSGGCTRWHAAIECPYLLPERCTIVTALKVGEQHVTSSGQCDEWIAALRIMQAGLGTFAPPHLRSSYCTRALPDRDDARVYILLRVLVGMIRFADPGKAAAKALEALVLVGCRWVWAAEEMMQSEIKIARDAADEVQCMTRMLQGWRVLIARGGMARAAELRSMQRTWAATLWAAQPAFDVQFGSRFGS